MSQPSDDVHRQLTELLAATEEVRALVRESERAHELQISRSAQRNIESARNLLHYVGLRSVDLRELQARLSSLGLSSLGRSEARVLPSLDAVAETLRALRAGAALRPRWPVSARETLAENASALLGPPRAHRKSRILVTAHSSFSDEPRLVEELVGTGMDLLRINCAHDGPDIWTRMVANVRKAEKKTGRSCRLLFDVAGPKIRTGAIGKTGEGKLRLEVGDYLRLTDGSSPGKPKKRKQSGEIRPVTIPCSIPQVFPDMLEGQRVFFDDGKLRGAVVQSEGSSVLLRIDQAPPGGGKLKAEKGINLPDTSLRLPSLMPEDLAALDFIVQHGDIVAQSFVRTPEDVRVLTDELERRGAHELGLVLKIETPSGFQRLPEILLAGMARERLGVMVARGDLAVEVGFVRLAEAQEEILWMCEAAHVPTIWATQVLETLATTGIPTRAEVTDAAMSARAECVMLNKGKYINEAVRFLDDVLARMEDHQVKKSSMLRPLGISKVGP